jgi:beta-1,4-galactosyltransferase 1
MYENIIAIPFRNRDEHLEYFIKNTVPLLAEHLPNSKVVIIEQNEGKLFNRGALLNVAFKEYQNKTKYFFTHDVDMNPTQDVIKTVYTNENIYVYRIKSAHNNSLGGVIKIKHDTIFYINGFPNNIWGWGIEDRALYHRCCMKNISITNNQNNNFTVMPHTSNALRYTDEKKKISDMWNTKYINQLDDKQKEEMIMSSGLNNLEYTILERKMIHDIVEIIKVDI